jgi:BirA family biotin operon repressor/biotin-[acetyl-CoA-carboxylase] ligase
VSQAFSDAIGAALPARAVLGRVRRVLASCQSTNDEAIAWARAGAPEGALVVAETQTRGRGRMGRVWSSPPGQGVYLSLVLRPSLPAVAAPPLTLAVGLGIADAVEALGVRPHLKWPNDLLADDDGQRRKLAGVLTEMATSGSRIEHVVVGIGLNVGAVELPAEIAGIATSLRRLIGRTPDRASVVTGLVVAIDRRYREFLRDGAGATVAAFRERVGFVGQRVRVSSGDDRIEGVAERIDDEGALHVREDGGKAHRLWAGVVALQ